MQLVTSRPRAGYTPAITGPVRRGAYENSRAAAKSAEVAELTTAALAKAEATSTTGCAAVVVRAQAALAGHNWSLAARLFAAAADASAPNPHGHLDATINALDHSARLSACMAATGPSRSERHQQLVSLVGVMA